MNLFRLALPALAAGTLTTAVSANPNSDAEAFFQQAGDTATEISLRDARAQWIFQTNITHDTQQLIIETGREETLVLMDLARQANDLVNKGGLTEKNQRDLNRIRQSINLPSPALEASTAELVEIGAELKSLYSTGKYCPENGECLSLREMELVLSSSRDADQQAELWQGWRQISPPMRDLYTRQVELANEGARDLGFADMGDYWRSRYDMSGDEFATSMERYWSEAKPLYQSLQCHVEAKLSDYYGEDAMPGNGMIPAHLTGNMWAQAWSGIEDIVMGSSASAPYNLTDILEEKQMDEVAMVEMAEKFFISLGLDPLPETFWTRSQFTKPRDREVVCHASAWDVDAKDDLRIKMCIQRTEDEVKVIHHELGHNYYQRAYKEHNFFHRGSANPGFHEALGDVIALSVNGNYLHQIDMLEDLPETDEASEIAGLMKLALDKVAFLPFALVLDKWRWQVFSGEVGREDYNAAWWKLREQYQGVTPPVARSEADFDPGAKYHIPGNVSYTRYFLAHLLQFQMHERMCELAGFEGPLHQCSIYNSKEAGKALNQLMMAGASQPWQDTLEQFSGERDVNPQAMLNYFAPLQAWLDEQNQGRDCGW